MLRPAGAARRATLCRVTSGLRLQVQSSWTTLSQSDITYYRFLRCCCLSEGCARFDPFAKLRMSGACCCDQRHMMVRKRGNFVFGASFDTADLTCDARSNTKEARKSAVCRWIFRQS